MKKGENRENVFYVALATVAFVLIATVIVVSFATGLVSVAEETGTASADPEVSSRLGAETGALVPETTALAPVTSTESETTPAKTPETVVAPATYVVVATTIPETVPAIPVETEAETTAVPALVETAEETPAEPAEKVVIDDVYGWIQEHDSDEEICSLAKKFSNGVLYVRVTCGEDQFVFESVAMTHEDTDWELEEKCFFSSDLVDMTFVVYHEVGGTKASIENLQAQASVILNRVGMKKFPNSIREVISQSGQYQSAKVVLARKVRSENFLEIEALERDFVEGVLPVLVGETVEKIPSGVAFAATKQMYGGIWKSYQGTVYSFYPGYEE